MKDSVQFDLQGTGYKLEYLTKSYLEIVNRILETQESIASIISGLDSTWGTVINKETTAITQGVEDTRKLIEELKAFTGYK